MALEFPDKRVWNFWFAQDGSDYHLFYLQAPHELAGREIRHWHASIGHSVSQDLRTWEELPPILTPSEPEAWDDCATWTGSIIRHEGEWFLLYTGTNQAEKGFIQRIGLATSPDLLHWRKHPQNPVIEADPQWYEVFDSGTWHDQAWRDPWIFQHPETGRFHAFITARAHEGAIDGRGVLAHAQSENLMQWEVLPPVTEPGDFGYLDSPQLVGIGQYYYVLFSVPARFHSEQRCQHVAERPVTGTHYMIGDTPLGPFRFCTDVFLAGTPTGLYYNGKIVQGPDKAWYYLTCHQFAPDGSFIGAISDPIPVKIEPDGSLHVELTSS